MERICPNCGDAEDLHFNIDDTVWCLACDWEGHEDELKGGERPPVVAF